MSTLALTVEPLSREAFAPFGEVIEAADGVARYPINGGSAERFHDLARVDPGAEGCATVSIVRGEPRALPFRVQVMERHPLASQAFFPLSGRAYLVAVAAAGAAPAAADLRVFLARADQGVNYRAGVWHHPLLVLGGVSDFLVVDRSGPGHNCDEVRLAPAGIIPALDGIGAAA